jgi:hypothetical protein
VTKGLAGAFAAVAGAAGAAVTAAVEASKQQVWSTGNAWVAREANGSAGAVSGQREG